jgi:integrase
MANIRKRSWTNKSGKHTCYEITYNVAGKQYKKGGYKTLLEAQLDFHNVVFEVSSDIKFSSLVNLFLTRHCPLNCKQSTTDLYDRMIESRFKQFMNKEARSITPKEVENLIFSLKATGLSNLTINKTIQLLRVIFNYAIDSEILSKSPVLKKFRLPEEKKAISVLDEEQIQAFLDVAKRRNIKNYAIMATFLYTGIRRGELLALEWSDIDFKNQRIKINKQIYQGKKVPTKNNKHRSVDIPNNLIEILQEYKKHQTVMSKIVFCDLEGGYMNPAVLERHYFCATLKALNNENPQKEIKIRLHDLRHTYATFLLSKGVPIKYVQEQLGHSSAKMTLDVYASYMPSVKFEALNILNNLHKKEPDRTQTEHEKLESSNNKE